VQRLEIRTGFPFLGRSRKYLGSAFQQLGTPLPDLVRVDLELLRELDQCLVALDRGERRLRFECGSMVTAGSFHLICSSAVAY
jgi:hypothetical protein